jgi:hypothetical protein
MKYVLPLFVFVLIASCESEDNSISTTFEPTIELVFINADSLSKLNDSTDVVNNLNIRLDGLISSLNDTLSSLVDSLEVIDDSIAVGGQLDAQKLSIEAAILDYSNQRTTLNEKHDVQDSLISVMNSIVSVINSGLVLVSQVEVIETGNLLSYEDSTSSIDLPLSFDGSFYQYSIDIDDETYTLELDYNLVQEIDNKRNVLIRANDIVVTQHSFDSLNACTENCTDGNATYIFYF